MSHDSSQPGPARTSSEDNISTVQGAAELLYEQTRCQIRISVLTITQSVSEKRTWDTLIQHVWNFILMIWSADKSIIFSMMMKWGFRCFVDYYEIRSWLKHYGQLVSHTEMVLMGCKSPKWKFIWLLKTAWMMLIWLSVSKLKASATSCFQLLKLWSRVVQIFGSVFTEAGQQTGSGSMWMWNGPKMRMKAQLKQWNLSISSVWSGFMVTYLFWGAGVIALFCWVFN